MDFVSNMRENIEEERITADCKSLQGLCDIDQNKRKNELIDH